ncbi:hypothetical protein HDU93_004801 [Gonapodya sp. JEL0774]|nr:hypothetical protein HDU93_004801 [Gonapodya sp. JEL0774]
MANTAGFSSDHSATDGNSRSLSPQLAANTVPSLTSDSERNYTDELVQEWKVWESHVSANKEKERKIDEWRRSADACLQDLSGRTRGLAELRMWLGAQKRVRHHLPEKNKEPGVVEGTSPMPQISALPSKYLGPPESEWVSGEQSLETLFHKYILGVLVYQSLLERAQDAVRRLGLDLTLPSLYDKYCVSTGLDLCLLLSAEKLAEILESELGSEPSVCAALREMHGRMNAVRSGSTVSSERE